MHKHQIDLSIILDGTFSASDVETIKRRLGVMLSRGDLGGKGKLASFETVTTPFVSFGTWIQTAIQLLIVNGVWTPATGKWNFPGGYQIQPSPWYPHPENGNAYPFPIIHVIKWIRARANQNGPFPVDFGHLATAKQFAEAMRDSPADCWKLAE